MSNAIVYQVVGGLLILFYFYLVYMFTKTWRWLHVTAMFFVFVATIFLAVYAAISVRTHMAWKEVVTKQRAQIERLEAENEQLIYGDLTTVTQTGPTLNDLTAELGRVILDRGRVWRNCVPSAPSGGTISLATAAAPAAEGEAPAPNRLQPDMVLYAFLEAATPEDYGLKQAKVPVFYFGEFTVTAATDTTVTLRPTLPIPPSVTSRMSAAGSTWVLYETMPGDGHNYFAVDPRGKPDWNQDADVAPIFGEMDPEQIARLFRPHEGSVPAAALDALKAEYARDGKRAGDNDPPENVWVKLRFLQDHEVDVDSDAELGAVDETYFDDRGMATVARVKRGGKAEIKKDDVGVFLRDSQLTQSLINDGIAELIEPIFVRKLVNYEAALRELAQQRSRQEKSIRQTERDNQALTEANERLLAQIEARTEERSKLQTDQEGVQTEQARIDAFSGEMRELWKNKRTELSRIYRENHQLLARLMEIEKELTRAIDEATAEALTATN